MRSQPPESGAPAGLAAVAEPSTFPDLFPPPRQGFPLGLAPRALTEPAPPRVPGYELLGPRWVGGMGVVYQARQASLDRVVALKLLPPRPGLAGAAGEAVTLAGFNHPHVVHVYDTGQHDGWTYLAMEFADGGTLADRLARPDRGLLPDREAARLVEVLARAVHAVHQRGVVHRDLKPSNVLLTRDGVPKISDFGLAVRPGAGGPATAGTPPYMAPEQALGPADRVGPATDVYALGVILYELLTGRPPFGGPTAEDVLARVMGEEPVPPGQVRPALPRDLETVCLMCLRKDAAARYPTAEDLAEDLRRFLTDRPVRARPAGPLDWFRKFARRNKALVGGTAAVFLALAGGVIGTGLALATARAERDRTLAALAESHAQAAHLAMRRGDWRAALDRLAAADAAGHPDSGRLRLDRVRAHAALQDFDRAGEELDALAGRPDLGELEASVLLWRADLALARSLDDDAALAQVREAERQGLPAAEAAYARGLLAESADAAEAEFARAVTLDPYQPRASALLACLLLLRGKTEEAGARVHAGALLFPDDPTFPVLRAALLAAGDDRPAGLRVLDELGGRLGEEDHRLARAFLDLAHELRQTEPVLYGDPGHSPFDPGSRLAKVWDQLVGNLRAPPAVGGPRRNLAYPVPPVFVRTLRDLAANPLGLLLGGPAAVAQFDRAARQHPDAFFHYAAGAFLANDGRWRDAEARFEQALKTSSLLPVRRPALFAAAAAQWELMQAERSGPGRQAWAARAAANANRFVALGGVSPRRAPTLAWIAANVGEPDLARWILTNWARLDPDSLEPARVRMRIEYQAGGYERAIAQANEILARLPRDPEAARIRLLACSRLSGRLAIELIKVLGDVPVLKANRHGAGRRSGSGVIGASMMVE